MSLNIHENKKEKLKYFHEIHKIPNIIFHGLTGSGKRSILMNLFIKYLEIFIKYLVCI